MYDIKSDLYISYKKNSMLYGYRFSIYISSESDVRTEDGISSKGPFWHGMAVSMGSRKTSMRC